MLDNLKGTVEKSVSVLIEGACSCLGTYLELGAEYLLVVKANATSYSADYLAENVCSGTDPVSSSQARKVMKILKQSAK